MAKKSALGDNFSSIFDEDGFFGEEDTSVPMKLKISEIEPNKNQPRKKFNEEALNALAESIMENGIIQPLAVRPFGDVYQIVAGERRWRAARIAGLTEVPVRIMELTDEQVALIALIENLQREDLNPIEEALGYQNMIETYGIKQDELAKKVGRARSTITNSLRLLALPDDVKERVRDGEISVGHCKVIIGVPDEEKQRQLAKRVIEDGLSVRALEKLAKQLTSEKKTKQAAMKDTFLVEAEVSMTDYIGKPVHIDKSKNKYTMSIDCKTEEELRELISFLSGNR